MMRYLEALLDIVPRVRCVQIDNESRLGSNAQQPLGMLQLCVLVLL